ncbi:MAG: alpha-glucosidase family protein [Xanthobacteraceae bacterium]|nr:alpha-glucosidase family protein [Xanthobacteraceae bacterium]
MDIETFPRSRPAIAARASRGEQWWRGAAIYQIYPRSFRDSDGDGIGDLRGIVEKLDHVAELGVDAIWISPFYRSPMKDFGYDVSDHCDVEPMFGTLADFDDLVARAHRLGLRVLIDQVWSHTSDEHPWFAASRAAREGGKADWYVWAEARPDGSPPNNWLSVFGGPAWTWDPRRRQYYLHHFLPAQPQLNLYNPAVVDAVLGIAAFWLDRGVDGFRLDAIDFMFHDRALRSNPPRQHAAGALPTRPFGMQQHLYDMLQPDVFPFLARLRAFLARYPGTVTLGEVSSEPGAYGRCAQYTDAREGRLDAAYTLALMKEQLTASAVRSVLISMDAAIEHGCVCWAFSNHDVVRAVTRWKSESDERLPHALTALLLTLPGNACIYQGEELGLPEADIAREDMRDPYGISFFPTFIGRDGARTPMPWAVDQPQAGFTTATRPWLPIPPDHVGRAVARQEADPTSFLWVFRRLIAWRKAQPALRDGGFRLLHPPEPVLVFERGCEQQRLLLAFNLQGATVRLPRDELPELRPVEVPDFAVDATEDAFVLPPYGVLIAEIEE